MFEKIFRLKENQTTVWTEIVAGITTFMTMAYIIFVQPQVMGSAGMDVGSVMMATCIASAIACIVMGLLANYPIGLAPGMGENFFFAYTVVLGMGVSWEKALGMVFISGVVFMLLSVFKVREMVISAVPASLKHGIAVGIGLFIALIGLSDAGIVVKNPGGLVMRGDFAEPAVILAIFGIIIIGILQVRKVKGAILIGMIATTMVGILSGILQFKGIVSRPPSIEPTLFKFDLSGMLNWNHIVLILTFLYMVLFDTVGTLIGVSSQAGLLKADGTLPRASRALFSDAVGTTIGAACGVSTVTSYVESVAGVKCGGRTGLTAVVVALFFVAAIFFYPLVDMISGGVTVATGGILHPVTAPALIVVGSMMMWGVTQIEWGDISESLPAFLTIILIPFTFSIAEGVACGFIVYPIVKLFGGRGREVSWLVYILAIIFILRYVFL